MGKDIGFRLASPDKRQSKASEFNERNVSVRSPIRSRRSIRNQLAGIHRFVEHHVPAIFLHRWMTIGNCLCDDILNNPACPLFFVSAGDPFNQDVFIHWRLSLKRSVDQPFKSWFILGLIDLFELFQWNNQRGDLVFGADFDCRRRVTFLAILGVGGANHGGLVDGPRYIAIRQDMQAAPCALDQAL